MQGFREKFREKISIAVSNFSDVVGQDPEALIDMELFLKDFMGISKTFLELVFFKKNNC